MKLTLTWASQVFAQPVAPSVVVSTSPSLSVIGTTSVSLSQAIASVITSVYRPAHRPSTNVLSLTGSPLASVQVSS